LQFRVGDAPALTDGTAGFEDAIPAHAADAGGRDDQKERDRRGFDERPAISGA